MELKLSKKQFRRLLDLVYLGNWVMNATRGSARIPDYDKLESFLFQQALEAGLSELSHEVHGKYYPSQKFVEGGIHNVLSEYEGFLFYEMLAEDLSLRDMEVDEINLQNYGEFILRIQGYLEEFEENATDRLYIQEEE